MTQAWCPRCEVLVDMEIVAGALLVCSVCGNSFTLLELQEWSYAEGYGDCLAEEIGWARSPAGSRRR